MPVPHFRYEMATQRILYAYVLFMCHVCVTNCAGGQVLMAVVTVLL